MAAAPPATYSRAWETAVQSGVDLALRMGSFALYLGDYSDRVPANGLAIDGMPRGGHGHAGPIRARGPVSGRMRSAPESPPGGAKVESLRFGELFANVGNSANSVCCELEPQSREIMSLTKRQREILTYSNEYSCEKRVCTQLRGDRRPLRYSHGYGHEHLSNWRERATSSASTMKAAQSRSFLGHLSARASGLPSSVSSGGRPIEGDSIPGDDHCPRRFCSQGWKSLRSARSRQLDDRRADPRR